MSYQLLLRVVLLLLILSTVSLSAAPVDAELSTKEWKRVRTDFKTYFGQKGNVAEKSDVMRRLLADGQKRAFKLAVEGLALECQLTWGLRAALQEETRDFVDQMAKHFRRPSVRDDERLKRLQMELRVRERDVQVEAEALEAILGVLENAPETLRSALFKRARSSKDWTYRAAVADLAARGVQADDCRSYVEGLFSDERDPRVRRAALDAVVDRHEGWEEWVIGRLADAHWSLRLQAVNVIRHRKLSRAVPQLKKMMDGEGPRLAEAIRAALDEMESERIERAPSKGAHFYGLPINSDRVMFIIDVSDSMKHRTLGKSRTQEWKPPRVKEDGVVPPPPPPPVLSGPKIDVAKQELKVAITRLPDGTRFNMIAFCHAAVAWKPAMAVASPESRGEALKWMRTLRPKGVTYIDGALRLAFKMAGLIDVDTSVPELAIDKMIVLSDGLPTHSDMRRLTPMNPEIILTHVRDWNAHRLVQIDCVGVDVEAASDFLSKLASQNGGMYVDR